jgi:hypothetical protein
MKNSIEVIWKEGFLNERSLVAPKINDLYNQKSKDLVDKIKRMAKINRVVIVIMAIVFPIIGYFRDFIWPGVATSILFLLMVGYSTWQKRNLKTLDHGANCLDYLKSFDRRIKDGLSRSEKVFRFIHPLSFLIAMSIIWSSWNKGPLTSKMYLKYPNITFIGSVPLFVWIIAGVATLLMLYFSSRIYRWDVRLVYGRVFDKIEAMIAEMEKLKQE